MFTAVLRDAWRQYRRRPLAAVVALAVGGLPVFLSSDNALVAVPLALALLAAGLLLELFLVAWLAGALDPVPTSAGSALAAMRANIAPGVRAGLLRVIYLLLALMVGRLLFGFGADEPLPRAEQTKLAVGLWPLFGLALAFLAVLVQVVVLGGQRRVGEAAAVSHKVASAHFPICLLIGLVQASGLVLASLVANFALLAALSLLLAAADPYLIAMGNALYLRTRADQAPTQVRPLPGG